MINNKEYSKTRQGSRNFSRESGFHEYSQDNSPSGIIRGVNSLGSPTVDQSRRGFIEPTVQGALDDIVNSMIIPVNGILESTEDLNPAGASQVDRVTVTGTVFNDFVMFNGFKIPVTDQDSAEVVTTTVIAYINQLVQENVVFDTVTQISPTVFEVKYIDTRPHSPIADEFTNGITFDSEVVVNSRGGFGTWTKVGEREIVTGITGYVWRRTS